MPDYFKHIAILKGTSGTGKSTKTYLLLKFLMACGMKFESIALDFECLEIPFGFLCKDLNVLFIGKEYTKNGNDAFMSLDYINSKLKHTEITCDAIKMFLEVMAGEP